MTAAYAGFAVPEDTCGHAAEDGSVCGEPAAYLIRFTGWRPWERAGTCALHAQVARTLDVDGIWTAKR